VKVRGDLMEKGNVRVYEGKLSERELKALHALIEEGLADHTDANFLFLSLQQSLDAFVPC